MNPEPASSIRTSSNTEQASCGCEGCRTSGWSAVGVIVLLAALVGWSVWQERGTNAQSASSVGPVSCADFDHGHSAWTALLQRYARNGLVDYAGLKNNGQVEFAKYLRALESCRGHHGSWTREQQLAYWINAYNAYTVQLILRHYPLKSIRSIGLLPGAAFRDDFIPLDGAAGKMLSLNDIEHEILRKRFQEPRIHFAIVCASTSCPVLRSEAYGATELDSQLDDAARAFIRNASRNRFDSVSRTLHLSSIFKWFREDFDRAAKSLPEFVARYTDESTASALRSGSVRVEFLDYDWSLNGR